MLFGKKKTVRRVFLFEELLLFSKPRAVERGVDILLYNTPSRSSSISISPSISLSHLLSLSISSSIALYLTLYHSHPLYLTLYLYLSLTLSLYYYLDLSLSLSHPLSLSLPLSHPLLSLPLSHCGRVSPATRHLSGFSWGPPTQHTGRCSRCLLESRWYC